jgi:hypothetical protein
MRPCSKRKQYVEVLATHHIDGTVRPRTIILADGPMYEIDEVKSVNRAKTQRTGEVALRYTIKIKNQETYLYDDSGRWFVEMKESSRR